MVPRMPNGNGGEHLMGLPLREAREVFEREYLRGADQPLRRQHLAHRRVRRHGALGAASQAQGARDRLTRRHARSGFADIPTVKRVRSVMSRIAYVNGRYVAIATRRSMSRTAAISSPTASTRSARCRGGRLVDERRHMARLERSLERAAHRACRCRARRSASCCARPSRRNRVRDGIVYLQVTRGVARRDHAFPAAGTAPSIVVTARSLDPRAARTSAPRDGIAVDHRAGQSLGARRHQDRRRCCRTCSPSRRRAKRAPRRPGSSTREGFVTEGVLDQCLDRDARRRAGHPAGRPRHPARHHPHGVLEVIAEQGLQARGAAVHAGRSLRGARGVHHLGDARS